MDASQCDVASGAWRNWNSVNWTTVHRTTRRLQARIAKAVRDGNWRGAKRLQQLLAHSTSGKFLAVRRVTENQGRKTPGVDNVTWSTPESKAQAVSTLSSKGYRALPLRRVHIPKNNGDGTRPLGIPTMRDRAMQALYLLTLEPISESTADGNSYGFRPFRSTADALVQCRNVLARKHSSRWILEGDIKGCLDASSQYTSSYFSSVKKARSGRRYLNSQAFAASTIDVNGLQLTTLYTLQDCLPCHAKKMDGFDHRHIAVRYIFNKA